MSRSMKDWYHDDDGSVTCDEIRIIANVTRLPPPAEGGLWRHPLKDIQLNNLEVQILMDGRLQSLEEKLLYLVTFDGTLTSREKLFKKDADHGVAESCFRLRRG